MNTDTQTEQPLAVMRPEELPQSMPVSLFGGTEPVQVIERAARVASALRDVIEKQGLVSTISGKKYPRCEAWTLLGTMIGVFPVCQWTRQLDGGWEARVEARTRDGAVVGAAEAQCLRSERNWASRDDFALRSMAQTRATAKALRMPLGFVMTLGGFEATPAEEMVYEQPKQSKATSTPPAAKNATKTPSRPNGGQRSATEATRQWMFNELASYEAPLLHEFAIKTGILLPTEDLGDWPLNKVPTSHQGLHDLVKAIETFAEGGAPPMETPSAGTRNADDEPDDLDYGEGEPLPKDIAGVIIPVPRKGQSRDEYLKNPQTIGSLYAARHGTDDEAQEARQRLWGFVHNYEAKPWTGKDGKQRPPSAADVKFREALDQFADWFAKTHPDEKL